MSVDKATIEQARSDAPPQVATSRVRLRLLDRSEFEWYYQLALRPDHAWRWRYRGSVPSREQFAKLIYENTLCQLVATRSDADLPLGVVALYDVHSQGHGKIAVISDPRAQAPRGIILEATALFIEYIFRVFPLRKLYAESPQYAYKDFSSGADRFFVEEGRLREHEFYAGKYWDLVVLGLTRESWSATKQEFGHHIGLE